MARDKMSLLCIFSLLPKKNEFRMVLTLTGDYMPNETPSDLVDLIFTGEPISGMSFVDVEILSTHPAIKPATLALLRPIAECTSPVKVQANIARARAESIAEILRLAGMATVLLPAGVRTYISAQGLPMIDRRAADRRENGNSSRRNRERHFDSRVDRRGKMDRRGSALPDIFSL
jgi:hypothetical protein